jgi:hypothetical protein
VSTPEFKFNSVTLCRVGECSITGYCSAVILPVLESCELGAGTCAGSDDDGWATIEEAPPFFTENGISMDDDDGLSSIKDSMPLPLLLLLLLLLSSCNGLRCCVLLLLMGVDPTGIMCISDISRSDVIHAFSTERYVYDTELGWNSRYAGNQRKFLYLSVAKEFLRNRIRISKENDMHARNNNKHVCKAKPFGNNN